MKSNKISIVLLEMLPWCEIIFEDMGTILRVFLIRKSLKLKTVKLYTKKFDKIAKVKKPLAAL